MDKPNVHHQRKSRKQPKPKKKLIKIVYFTDPIMVKTTASRFRSLVQELTGRDSDVADAAKFSEISGVQGVPDLGTKVTDDAVVVEVPGVVGSYGKSLPGSSESFLEAFDDDLPYQMLEGSFEFLPSEIFYGSSSVDVSRSSDAV